jgi:hypothetical protein
MNAKQWHVSLLVVFSCLTALLTGSARAEHALDDEITMLSILDGSDSMWGQIDDQDEITIAKNAMTDLIHELPETVDEGLLAYGHPRKGDGNDIEMRKPAAEEDSASMIGVVQGISPRGKTPITRSLEMVAKRLRALQEGRVVLVSGGEPAPEATKTTQRTIAIAAPGILAAPRLQHDPIQVKNAASGTRIVTLHPRQARAPVPAGSYAIELNGSLMTIEVAAGETVELPEPAIIKIINFDAPGAGGSLVKVKNVDSSLGTIMSRRKTSAAFWPGHLPGRACVRWRPYRQCGRGRGADRRSGREPIGSASPAPASYGGPLGGARPCLSR